jgi:hypothetical protein
VSVRVFKGLACDCRRKDRRFVICCSNRDYDPQNRTAVYHHRNRVEQFVTFEHS